MSGHIRRVFFFVIGKTEKCEDNSVNNKGLILTISMNNISQHNVRLHLQTMSSHHYIIELMKSRLQSRMFVILFYQLVCHLFASFQKSLIPRSCSCASNYLRDQKLYNYIGDECILQRDIIVKCQISCFIENNGCFEKEEIYIFFKS